MNNTLSYAGVGVQTLNFPLIQLKGESIAWLIGQK